MKNELKLFTDGIVEVEDYEFTRLVGGFGNDNPVITTKQVAELLGYEQRTVNQTINRNKYEFEENVHIIDIKKVITQSDNNLEMLKSLGYTNMAIAKAKNIYILSKAGFLLYLKFAEGDKAIEIYKNFIEDYFKTKAENKVMKETIEDQIEKWEEIKGMAIGKAVIAKTDEIRNKYLFEMEEANKQLEKLHASLKAQEIVKKLQPKLHIAETLTESSEAYDIGTFSKILGAKGYGRNNMFAWLKEKEILMRNNEPYQRYMNYFKVLQVNKGNYTGIKTLLKPNGIEYIVKRMIDDGIIITKSVDDILEELESYSVA